MRRGKWSLIKRHHGMAGSTRLNCDHFWFLTGSVSRRFVRERCGKLPNLSQTGTIQRRASTNGSPFPAGFEAATLVVDGRVDADRVGKPFVSTSICRLMPDTSLPLSKPFCSTISVLRTLCASTISKVVCSCRPRSRRNARTAFFLRQLPRGCDRHRGSSPIYCECGRCAVACRNQDYCSCGFTSQKTNKEFLRREADAKAPLE